IFGIAPIEMVIIDEAAIEKQSTVRFQSARNHVGGVGGSASITGRSGAAFRIGFHHESGKVWNFRVESIGRLLPPRRHPRVERIIRWQGADLLGAADVNGES